MEQVPNRNIDPELLTSLTAGDTSAFETIYRQNVADLYRYAKKSMSSKEDCEEIVQEVFESLWTRRESLTHITAIRPYLFSMVKYKIIRYFQHKKVIEKYEQHYLFFETAYDSLPEEERTPELIQQRLIECLETLPPRCQMVMRLRILENLSSESIAKQMNIKKSTVKRYVTSAYDHLRGLRETIYRPG